MNLLQFLTNTKNLSLLKIFIAIILFFSCTKEDNMCCDIEPNSIVIVPDIQIYTKTDNSYELSSIVNFINSNKSNISACLQTGDLTNNNKTEQWSNVLDCYINRIYPEIPHFECLGNHDYGHNGTADVRISNILWDISHNSKSTYGNYNENYVQFIQIGGEEYGILVLEFAARAEVLEWAQKTFKLYPNRKFIVLTHAFLNSDGIMYSESTFATDLDNPQSYDMAVAEDSRNSEQIFNALCGASPNLEYIICGHSLPKEGFKVSTQTNYNGVQVKFIMVNFQHFENGGNGNIAILNIESESLLIYSTKTKQFIQNIDL